MDEKTKTSTLRQSSAEPSSVTADETKSEAVTTGKADEKVAVISGASAPAASAGVVAPDTSGKSTTDQRKKKRKGKRRKKRIDMNLKCPLCESGVKRVTYKDVYQLKKFTSVRGKIISTEKSGVCSKHQRQLTNSIKRSRFIALLPYVATEA